MEKSGLSVAVLFVCTGNICRSPTAEAVFRHHARAQGVEGNFVIDSAGTHGYHIGDPPDPRAISTALARGVDMRGLRARKVDAQDFQRFDYVIAMDAGHYRVLSADRQGNAEIMMFLQDGGDVPDPYYGTLDDFENVYDIVGVECAQLLDRLRKRHGI